MLTAYPAILHEEEGQFWVEFPDLDGCFSDGLSLPGALKNAEEALGLYLSSLMDRDIPVPAPSSVASIVPKDGVATLIVADPMKYRRSTKAVKKTLTIPEWLNVEAEKQHVNFSAVLQQALKQHLHLS